MLKLLKDAPVSGKRVLLRADLDVPIENGRVGEDYRLKALQPTLSYLREKEAKVLIAGHAGRPGGKFDPAFSLRPVAAYLGELRGEKVSLLETTASARQFTGPLGMLENLRFWPGEEENDPAFAQELADLADLYVNESFAASHRAHASIVGVPQHLPAWAGLRLEREVAELGGVLKDPARPLVFVLGGAKTETKAPLVPAFARVADEVLLGGRLMFDRSLEKIDRVTFPIDALETFDIGPESVKKFAAVIKGAGTVVWNGPLGKWEDRRYAAGTRALAEELAKTSAKTIVGGGDTIAALSAFGLLEKMGYVSLGGGAMLEFLAGKELPGLAALGYH